MANTKAGKTNPKNRSVGQWINSGDPWIWIYAGAVSICVITVLGLLLLLGVKGFGHFWPSDILEVTYAEPVTEGQERQVLSLIGEIAESQEVSIAQLQSAGLVINEADHEEEILTRYLFKVGNRDVTSRDFMWVLRPYLSEFKFPEDLVVIERKEWGNFYGRITELKQHGITIWRANQSKGVAFDVESNDIYGRSMQRAQALQNEIERIEKGTIGDINHRFERLRLQQRRDELDYGGSLPIGHSKLAELNASRSLLDREYKALQLELAEIYREIERDTIVVETADGQSLEIPYAKVVHVLQPNKMSVVQKSITYCKLFFLFITDDPREANTEGGIFPAIFGTVMMVVLMSVMVTPCGVVAAVYLHEYAKQGLVTRLIRISVNNLAGVPSIVYGVFGLGFFVYFVGGNIDNAFFPESLPAPTFGTPGMLWASLTLALLTLPVVIVATEEGLARIPRAVREGSLALGATKAETLWKIVLPIASPAMMTGLILAVARAAGEVAPLMLVGVVKLAPSLPLDGHFPYVHLDQKFMHLGFHIYDVGFQSPNVEAARPLVYATSFLLVVIIAVLNFSAVTMRNHLREKYKLLES
ncbi:MAG: phosphate ABC transporter permease PstA [Pseudomonadales bacterium]|nr:phosphate ABC transporter permease PstA [Pseudomonadales bacterium]